jgi:type 1 glutamine amidotransferase
MRLTLAKLALTIAALVIQVSLAQAAEKTYKALIVDGQNNHQWQKTTPLIKTILEKTGRFNVQVETTPAKGGDMATFKPQFSGFDVVLSNYNGQPWSAETSKALTDYVHAGGGFVCIHAADNSFPEWKEYNEMIGLGGWGGRNEKNGPYVRWREGKFDRDTQAGRGGSHGNRHAFEVVVRDASHPITRGIPRSWMQAEDELYAELRGPATNLQVLATAFSDKNTKGTGEHEPILMVVDYGKGRVFHTTLGHDAKAMSGAGFQITLARGAEWAATGDVTQPAVTAAQLTPKEPAMHDPSELELPAGSAKAEFAVQPKLDAKDWVLLFNGKDLTGWTQKNGTAKYAIEDGCVVGRTSEGSPNSFLCTERDYADFELAFEVKVDDALNSGVQIRSKSLAEKDNGRVHGPQVEIEVNGTAGYVYGEATGRGWLSPNQDPTDAFQKGQWNKYLIRAVGPRIQTWINGRKIEDIYDPTSYQSGFIGLQVHGIPKDKGPYEVRWRDIRIHEIR